MTAQDTEFDGMTLTDAIASEKEETVDREDTPMEAVRAELNIGEGVDPLAALLNAPKEPPTDDVFLARLGVNFVVKAITDDKLYDRLVEQCTKYIKNRRGAGRTQELDGRRLARLTVANFTVSPSFMREGKGYDALVERYGAEDPEDLVQAALLLGEVDALADKIMSLTGFDDEVEQAGN